MKIILDKFDFQSDRILHSLNDQHKDELLSVSEKLVFKRGKLIFYESGIPTGVFLVQSGRAKIYKTGLDGKDQIFYIYNQGDMLGYHALLCDERYEDSCEAIEDCEVLFVNKRDFTRLLQDIPNLQLLLIQNMSHEFGVMVNTITMLAQKPVRERLAIYLLILQKRYADDGNKEGIITLSRIDLANLVGTARESLGRLLKEFREEKLIAVDSHGITLTEVMKLNKIASSDYSTHA